MKGFDRSMTSSCVDADRLGGCHTCGCLVRKKHIDKIVGASDLQSTTWYLNKTRRRTWDHFPLMVNIDRRDLRVKEGKKGWAGWIPKTEDDRQKFQELALCPNGSRR